MSAVFAAMYLVAVATICRNLKIQPTSAVHLTWVVSSEESSTKVETIRATLTLIAL